MVTIIIIIIIIIIIFTLVTNFVLFYVGLFLFFKFLLKYHFVYCRPLCKIYSYNRRESVANFVCQDGDTYTKKRLVSSEFTLG
jgi:hypothetical protein